MVHLLRKKAVREALDPHLGKVSENEKGVHECLKRWQKSYSFIAPIATFVMHTFGISMEGRNCRTMIMWKELVNTVQESTDHVKPLQSSQNSFIIGTPIIGLQHSAQTF